MSKYILNRKEKNKNKKNIYVKNGMVNTSYVSSRYMKQDYRLKKERMLGVFFLFCFFVLPQYFGLDTPGFDLTCQRIATLLVLIYILSNKELSIIFWRECLSFDVLPFMVPYLLVTIYTGVLRTHVGTFMYDMIEFLTMFVLIYVIRHLLGFDETVHLLQIFSYILAFQGIIEYITGVSLFSYLETITGLYTGPMIRSGSYRIMGPANHSLGYGLMLVVILAISTIDLKRHKLYILSHPILFTLIFVNIMLTGSRSTEAVAFIEILVLFIFSEREERKKTFLVFFILLIVLAIIVFGTYGSSISNYILLQITSIIDAAFDTTYSAAYGADIKTLSNSSNYRDYLPKIFTLNWLSPILGRGSQFVFRWYVDGFLIRSIDNYYVVTYVKYAYPGLITYILFMIGCLKMLIKKAIKYKSSIMMAILIGFVMYFINLYWVDTLQTLKYVYCLVALGYSYLNEVREKDSDKKSKLIRRING